MIDTHCHLTHERFAGDVDDVISRAQQAGVSHCITIGTGCADAEAGQALRGRHGCVYCAAGIDPFTAHDLGAGFDEELERLRRLMSAGEFVALGEVGLDYHYDDLEPQPVQRKQLEAQLEIAEGFGLPVVIHVREAHRDMAAVLANAPNVRGVIHSFTGEVADAERYLELDWHLAFNGIVTFRNAASLRQAAAIVPEEKLLVETDSPYLAPVPLRGKRCEPGYVAHVLTCLAEVRRLSVEDLREQTSKNARSLFRI